MEGAKIKILEVATRLFAEKGFAGISIRELTMAANVNVAAISYYFGGKEGLYEEVIRGQLAWTKRILEVIREKKELNPVQRLWLYLEMHSDIRKKLPLLGKFMNSEISNPTTFVGPIIIEHITQINEFVYTLLKEGIEQGFFRKDINIAYCTIILAGILNFYFISKPFVDKLAKTYDLTCTGYINQALDSKSYMQHAFEVFLHGIAKQ